MKKLLICILFFFLFASGSVKHPTPVQQKMNSVSKTVDDFTCTLDRLEVSASKLNRALK